MILETRYIPTYRETEALQHVQDRFGAAWKSTLIVNVWLAADGGASYFDADTCAVLQALRSRPAFDLASYGAAPPASRRHTTPQPSLGRDLRSKAP